MASVHGPTSIFSVAAFSGGEADSTAACVYHRAGPCWRGRTFPENAPSETANGMGRAGARREIGRYALAAPPCGGLRRRSAW
jgi:hypothetical protein